VCFYSAGTPTDAIWPGVSKLPDYKTTFPRWPAQNLATIVPTLGSDGIDLVTVIYALIVWSTLTEGALTVSTRQLISASEPILRSSSASSLPSSASL
jgi:hypothetical protein